MRLCGRRGPAALAVSIWEAAITCTCHIIPEDVLRRLGQDQRLSEAQRKSFDDTIRLDGQMRRLRSQATKVSRVMRSIAGPPRPMLAAPLAPTVSVFNCQDAQSLPGAPETDPPTSADATVVRVFTQTTSLARFYLEEFGRSSVDGAGTTLLSSVHYGVNYNNAFWNGSEMAYGDGDGAVFIDFSLGNDVIGHEVTHGVTQHSLQLGYTGETGGLNESLSDCFGSMFRQWEAGQTADQADWLIGSSILGGSEVAAHFTCLRDLADPGAAHCLTRQPRTYADITPTMDPHYSSGPANLAFCTACKAVGGQTWKSVGQVWYQAMTGFGPSPNLKMKPFADRTRSMAVSLFSQETGIATAIDEAWRQVGL